MKLLTVILTILGLVLIMDGFRFVMICKGNYGTPWYSNSWIENPVETLVLSMSPSKDYVTTNASHTEIWTCKEVSFAGKEFWTCLDRRPLNRVGPLDK